MKRALITSLCLGLLLWGAAAMAEPEVRPAAPAVTPGTATVNTPSNYTLKPTDEIEVRVFRNPELDGTRRISKDGTIDFPLLGIVNVSGKTTYEAAARLAALLDKDYLVRPQVFVNVVSIAKRRFNVLGQVNSPGMKEYPDEKEMDLLGAIAAAGGFTRIANQSNIIVRRQVDGKDETIKVDGKKLSEDANSKPFIIQANDTIVVKERFF